MRLGAGMRLGPYEIQFALGAGGMGEVYRARDTKLNRDVALKVLPEAFALDPDRVARFKREAQLLASLNHPNIAAIYGLEEADGLQALVLELVEGPTLADEIVRSAGPSGPAGVPGSKGPGLQVDEVLLIARQLADALEAAHEHGVVHRDLKPANVKLRPDGAVKVLDFGLAKALDPVPTAGDMSQSPTMTSPAMTRLGMILGTAAYIAPEQARGRVVDKRADIWAFGCVLFEMLTGQRAFDGEDVAETLGAVIHKQPPWSALPADTPQWLRTLLRRCLQKDPKKRLPHIGLARIEIEDAPADGSPSPSAATEVSRRGPRSNARLAWSVAAVTAAAAVAMGVTMYLAPGTVDAPVVARASILPPPGVSWATVPPNTSFALSPDGRRLAFLGSDSTGTRLWVRPIEALTAQPLAGTEGVVLARWSPDNRFLAFVAGGSLRKMDASGGPSITLADKASNWGLAWSTEDDILFAPDGNSPLFRVSASGGEPTQVTTLDAANTGHGYPSFLPDGRHFLYLERGDRTAVLVGSLDATEEPRLLLQDVYNAQYASGYLLFTRDATLMAQRFDASRLELSGEAAPLAEQLRLGGATGRAAAVFASQAGALVYQTGQADIRSQLTWYDRGGKPVGTLGEPAAQMSVELSPDGTRVLTSLLDSARQRSDLWIYDVSRNLRTRFTFDPGVEAMGTWSPDGSRVVFNARRADRFDLYVKPSSGIGAEELLVADDRDKAPSTWSADGRVVAYHSNTPTGRGAQDLWTAPITGDRTPAVLLQTEFGELRPRFSPDGQWLAYTSNESGGREVYVVPFPDRSGKWQVSTAGGDWPRWRRDGRELFYVAPDNTLMAAAVSRQGTAFQVGAVERLFELRLPSVTGPFGGNGYGYDVAPDGQRFLVNTLLEETSQSSEPLTLLVNWPAMLRR